MRIYVYIYTGVKATVDQQAWIITSYDIGGVVPQAVGSTGVFNFAFFQTRFATPCSTAPCVNGGICVAMEANTYQCSCLTGFSGVNCEVPTDRCIGVVCHNSAACQIVEGLYATCVCGTFYVFWWYYHYNISLTIDVATTIISVYLLMLLPL